MVEPEFGTKSRPENEVGWRNHDVKVAISGELSISARTLIVSGKLGRVNGNVANGPEGFRRRVGDNT